MSSVINSKQEKEKKTALAEERRKRERRRLKDMGGANGVVTPEDEDGEEDKPHGLAARQHLAKGSRSLSPAVAGHENGPSGVHPVLNGARTGSPTRVGGPGATRDSFLNYFFGKEGGLPGGNGVGVGPGQLSTIAGGHRHVSHNIEPSFAQSIRRGEDRVLERLQPQHDLESNHDHRDYDYGQNFVSLGLFSLLFIPPPPLHLSSVASQVGQVKSP